MSNRRRLQNPQDPRNAVTRWAASLDGARIPGGCEPCAADQTVHVIDHGVDHLPGPPRRLAPRAPKEAAPMTVHNRRCDNCPSSRQRSTRASSTSPGVALAWALLPPLLNGP